MRGTVPKGVVCPCGLMSDTSEPTCAPSASARREPMAMRPLPGTTPPSVPDTTCPPTERRMSATDWPRTSTASTRPL